MKDPAIFNLVASVPHLDRLIAAQRARASTLPAEKRVKLLNQLEKLAQKVEHVRRKLRCPKKQALHLRVRNCMVSSRMRPIFDQRMVMPSPTQVHEIAYLLHL